MPEPFRDVGLGAILEFDPEGHIYTWNGKRVPSASDVVKWAVPNPGAAWYTEESRNNGSDLHEAIRHRSDVDLYEGTPIHGKLVAYYQFLADSGLDRWGCEEPHYSQKWDVAGTPDEWGKLNGKFAVVDYKSGQENPGHAIQLGIYAILLEEQHGIRPRRLSVYLRDGRYKLVARPEPLDVTEAALTLFRWVRSKKLWSWT